MVSGTIILIIHINIQVDFESVRLIQAVATQSRSYDRFNLFQWVTQYRFLYSIDCVTFIPYTTADGTDKVIWKSLLYFCRKREIGSGRDNSGSIVRSVQYISMGQAVSFSIQPRLCNVHPTQERGRVR